MKKLIAISSMLVLSCLVFGQARDGTSSFQRTQKSVQVAMLYLPYAPTVVTQSLRDYLSKTTRKEQHDAKGYLLSTNTELVKNNIRHADLLFEIGTRDNRLPNESVIYLKLNSNYQSAEDENVGNYTFDMEEAKSYLDNLAIAIQPYAEKLQLDLQRHNLVSAEDKSKSLVKEGNMLDQKRIGLNKDMAGNNSSRKDDKISKRQSVNNRKMDANRIAQDKQEKIVNTQTIALAKLENPNH